MITYLILNTIFLGLIIGTLRLFGPLVINKSVVLTLVILCVCTALFDSLIIAADIVRYDNEKILGLLIGTAPIEDFFYALLAGILIPAIWRIGGRHE